MGDGGGGGDLGASTGPGPTPAEDNHVVVDHSGDTGIVLGADGGGHIVLPARPTRPDENDAEDGPAASAGPPEPHDS